MKTFITFLIFVSIPAQSFVQSMAQSYAVKKVETEKAVKVLTLVYKITQKSTHRQWKKMLNSEAQRLEKEGMWEKARSLKAMAKDPNSKLLFAKLLKQKIEDKSQNGLLTLATWLITDDYKGWCAKKVVYSYSDPFLWETLSEAPKFLPCFVYILLSVATLEGQPSHPF